MIDEKLEWAKCHLSLLYFLREYVWIQDRIQQKFIRWQPWPHLVRFISLIQAWAEAPEKYPLFLIIFKSRQVGASTTVSAIANWLCGFFESTKAVMVSQTEREGAEMIQRNAFINEHLPPFLAMSLNPNADSVMGYPSTHSIIRALPSTEEAGRSTDVTMVVCDEWERHFTDQVKAKDSFASLKPTMAKGGLFIGVTTIDKTRKDSFPQQVYMEAKQGVNGFTPLFWDYFVVPGRDEATYTRDTMGLPEYRKEAEYPRNEKEAFQAPKTMGFFNHDILEKMLTECRDPLESRFGGLVRIWTPSITTRNFIFAVDSSEGQSDPSVGIIADSQTLEDVACYNGFLSLDEQAKIIFELYKEYNEPLLAVESNASGLTLIEKLKNLGVTNWFYADKERKKPGWYTSVGTGRQRMLNELAEQVHMRRKRIPIKDCIQEMFDFIWLDDKPQAVRGKHDDWVMCEAILGQIAKSSMVNEIKFSSFRYKV